MSGDGLTNEEIYSSLEYQQYALILDDLAAYYYARKEILVARQRAALAAEPLPYREWYRQYLQTQEWRERAETAKARFGGRCALCNAVGALEAHHRTYERVGNEWPEDLTALCSDCHRAYHGWRLAAAGSWQS